MRYLLLGYGISNKSIEKYFIKENIKYDIYDDNINEFLNIDSICLSKYDYVIKSSGINNNHYLLKECKKNNINIISDLELFYKFCKCKEIIVITGTVGKSTVVSMLSFILNSPCIGNIGVPLFDYIDYEDSVIIEASSYMCEYLDEFKADIYGFLNIYPNHLDMHGDYNNYINSKKNLIKNISNTSYLVYNDKFSEFSEFGNLKCNLNKLSEIEFYNNRLYIEDEEIVCLDKKCNINVDDLKMVIQIGYLKNIDPFIIDKKIKNYRGLKYRLEYIKEYEGVKIYNDSKSTNLHSLNNALECFKDSKVLLICGGYDNDINLDIIKNYPYIALINGINNIKVGNYFLSKNVITIIKDKLIDCLESVKDIVKKYKIDIILFSPGYQSFDQFKNFEDRGRFFENYILNNL